MRVAGPNRVEEDGITLSFSPTGRTLVAIVDHVLHIIDWQRNKVRTARS